MGNWLPPLYLATDRLQSASQGHRQYAWCSQIVSSSIRCRFTVWANGETSNPGIQEIAELGSGGAFMEEVAACGAACGPGEGFVCEPMSGVCSAKGEVRMVAAYPYLSTATMVAPSPDWCAPPSSRILSRESEAQCSFMFITSAPLPCNFRDCG